MSKRHELPAGWAPATASDLLTFVTSGSRGWARYYSDNGALFLRIGNLDHDTIALDFSDVQHVTPPAGAEGERTRVQAGDLLVSITAELGMVALVPEGLGEAYVNQHIALARPVTSVDARYLAWFFASKTDGKRQLLGLSRGATKVGLGLDDIRRVELALPPLNEQRRIVAKVETLTARSRAAREALEKMPALLERFRQSVLAAAFRGDLTAEWRRKNPDVEPASVLLDRIRAERRRRWEEAELVAMRAKGKVPANDKWKGSYEEPAPVDTHDLPELPDGWCWTSLDTLSEFVTSGSRGWADYYSASGPLFIRAQDINTDSLVLTDVAHVAPPDSAEGRRTRTRRGDLLITITGGNVTKAAAVNCELPEAYVSQHVGLVRLVATELLPLLHMWVVAQHGGRRILLERAYGGGKPGLGLAHLRTLPVPFCPPSEMPVVMAAVRRKLELVGRVVDHVTVAREQLRTLGQSILAKAFRGELVPQDPADEPATTLLERIRAEREAAEGSGNGTRRRRTAAKVVGTGGAPPDDPPPAAAPPPPTSPKKPRARSQLLEAVLATLKRDALHRIADAAGVELADRRSLEAARDGLLRADVGLEAVLAQLDRDELKAVCRALDLEDRGKTKAELRDRIMAASGPAGAA